MEIKASTMFIILSLMLNSLYCIGSERGYENNAITVIFDTDLGNDVDDVMALQMLLNYQKQSKIQLLGITVSKANPYSMLYVDGYCKYNGNKNIPLGYVYEGPNKDDGKYIKQTLDTIIDGEKILNTSFNLSHKFAEAYKLQRKILSSQPDNSIVIIATGPLTNLYRLLLSKADNYSKFNGLKLIQKKVKKLIVMGGNFDVYGKSSPEWNIVQDIRSAQIVFDKWPTGIIASGFEVGQKILFPHQNICKNLPNGEKHPLSISYKLFDKMPYDRPTWDLTAVLYAINPKSNYFDISNFGKISIDNKGNSLFLPQKGGKHQYLSINDNKMVNTTNALIHSVICIDKKNVK